MPNTYRDILENNKDWEDQIPLLETLRDITNDEIKKYKKRFLENSTRRKYNKKRI